jgi:hypothetical protein
MVNTLLDMETYADLQLFRIGEQRFTLHVSTCRVATGLGLCEAVVAQLFRSGTWARNLWAPIQTRVRNIPEIRGARPPDFRDVENPRNQPTILCSNSEWEVRISLKLVNKALVQTSVVSSS